MRAFTHWSCINVAGQSGRAYLNARAYKAARPPDCHPFLFSEQDNTWQKKVKRLKEEEISYHTFMESPLLETRACPSCPGLIAGADPHHLCFECLGDQDMAEAVPFKVAIPAGLRLPGRMMTTTSRPWKSTTQVCPPGLPPGVDHGGGACRATAPPTHHCRQNRWAASTRGSTARSTRRSQPSFRPRCQISGWHEGLLRTQMLDSVAL